MELKRSAEDEMPVSKNKRKKPKRKRKRITEGGAVGGGGSDEGASGALMGLRSGFKGAVGSDGKKTKSPAGKAINWALMVAAVGLIIFFIYQMATK